MGEMKRIRRDTTKVKNTSQKFKFNASMDTKEIDPNDKMVQNVSEGGYF